MNLPNIEDFELHFDLIVKILKTQDISVVQSFKRGIKTLADPEYIQDVVIAAMYYLADSDPVAFIWALHNYDLNLYLELRWKTSLHAVRKLINRGFVLGRDFSTLPCGGLAISPEAQKALMEDPVPCTMLLLQEVLQPNHPLPAHLSAAE